MAFDPTLSPSNPALQTAITDMETARDTHGGNSPEAQAACEHYWKCLKKMFEDHPSGPFEIQYML